MINAQIVDSNDAHHSPMTALVPMAKVTTQELLALRQQCGLYNYLIWIDCP